MDMISKKQSSARWPCSPAALLNDPIV
jgi:hypothetical protein